MTAEDCPPVDVVGEGDDTNPDATSSSNIQGWSSVSMTSALRNRRLVTPNPRASEFDQILQIARGHAAVDVVSQRGAHRITASRKVGRATGSIRCH